MVCNTEQMPQTVDALPPESNKNHLESDKHEKGFSSFGAQLCQTDTVAFPRPEGALPGFSVDDALFVWPARFDVTGAFLHTAGPAPNSKLAVSAQRGPSAQQLAVP